MTSILEIGAAIVTVINAVAPGTFAISFAAELKLLPETKLTDLDTLHATISPAAALEEIEGRRTVERDDTLLIVLQKKVPAPNTPESVELVRLAESVREWMRMRAVTGAGWRAVCLALEHDPIFNIQHIKDDNVFTSVIAATFKIQEAVT